MQVIYGLDSVNFSGVVLAIGNFDGVHRGHQEILRRARQWAQRKRTHAVAMTFDPHPSMVLTPDHAPAMLTPLEDKLHYLKQAGADVAVVVRAERSFLNIAADDFLREIIVGKFKPVAMVEGSSFGFGHRRQGDVNTLRAAGPQYGFEVDEVLPISIILGGHTDTIISSSLIRHLLSSGAVDQAAQCLGRCYSLSGEVEHGMGRGAKFGVPTANLLVEQQMVPAEGVYAGRTIIDGRPVAAAISIGRAETFGGEKLLNEAHLLDFQGDLYERKLRIEFLQWLRRQIRYDTVEALYKQIDVDIEQTRSIFEDSIKPDSQ